MEKKGWTERDVIKKDRIRSLNDEVFGWIGGNILHSGLLEEMSDHEFKLYGFYCLAGDKIYSMSYYGERYVAKILKMSGKEIRKARANLVKKDLVAYVNKVFVNSKELKYKKTIVQVLSLPIDKIVITRRKKTEKELTPFEQGLQRYSLTKGYGEFLPEPKQDQLIVQIMRDLDLNPEVQETIKAGLRRGEIRVKK